ncbi:MAG TPA: FRG domain-containing protein [Nitrospinota bacterium]|nr:FRG domain-containing protein [Nitrospinota bacterium]
MSIEKKKFNNSEKAIRFLENLAFSNDNYIFRGHPSSKYRLQTTYYRHTLKYYSEEYRTTINIDFDINTIIDKFRTGLVRNDIPIPFDEVEFRENQDWLEYARHYGVPIPCLDFTYSPYIALFFAFNELHISHKEKGIEKYVVVYALNLNSLSFWWCKLDLEKLKRRLNKESKELTKKDYDRNLRDCLNAFLNPNLERKLGHRFPENEIIFIPYPSRYNKRMQKQAGALLYDTLNHKSYDCEDLEGVLENIKETPEVLPDRSEKISNTLTKIFINKKCAKDVFQRLELMEINGGKLFQDENGVRMDVVNTFHYSPKTSYLRDISLYKY